MDFKREFDVKTTTEAQRKVAAARELRLYSTVMVHGTWNLKDGSGIFAAESGLEVELNSNGLLYVLDEKNNATYLGKPVGTFSEEPGEGCWGIYVIVES